MKKIRRILAVGLGFGLVACALGLLTSKPAPAAPLPASVPVVVTNTSLPVTGNVSITNTSLPVTGSVSGLITNPANNPAMVSNVNDSVDREFSGWLCEADYSDPPDCGTSPIVLAGGAEEFINSFTVPTTTPVKGLPVTQAVIEYVSGICRADATDDIVEVGIANLPSIGITFFAPLKTPGTARAVYPVPGQNNPTTWSFDHTTKLYLPPGLSINLFVRSTGMPNINFAQRCDVNFWGTLLTQ